MMLIHRATRTAALEGDVESSSRREVRGSSSTINGGQRGDYGECDSIRTTHRTWEVEESQ